MDPTPSHLSMDIALVIVPFLFYIAISPHLYWIIPINTSMYYNTSHRKFSSDCVPIQLPPRFCTPFYRNTPLKDVCTCFLQFPHWLLDPPQPGLCLGIPLKELMSRSVVSITKSNSEYPVFIIIDLAAVSDTALEIPFFTQLPGQAFSLGFPFTSLAVLSQSPALVQNFSH